jgi:hypothetical protein
MATATRAMDAGEFPLKPASVRAMSIGLMALARAG